VGVEGSNPFARSSLVRLQKPRNSAAFCFSGSISPHYCQDKATSPFRLKSFKKITDFCIFPVANHSGFCHIAQA
ncbi:hypothetical protein, partial [Pseudochrobactrum sp. AO18b]|uniref:hypothetical protein n=1 Tax=Pseudochrobactrum sp. AO18b TaxID=1201036 RepID=UPI001AEC7079